MSLAELLRRRGQSLDDWMKSVGITVDDLPAWAAAQDAVIDVPTEPTRPKPAAKSGPTKIETKAPPVPPKEETKPDVKSKEDQKIDSKPTSGGVKDVATKA